MQHRLNCQNKRHLVEAMQGTCGDVVAGIRDRFEAESRRVYLSTKHPIFVSQLTTTIYRMGLVGWDWDFKTL